MEGRKKPLGREGLGYFAPLILKFNFVFIFNRVCVCESTRVCIHMWTPEVKIRLFLKSHSPWYLRQRLFLGPMTP